MPPHPSTLETDPRLPSGEWKGFYLQPILSRHRFKMTLYLTFKEGTFTGEGMDSIREFLIRGRYDLKSGEVIFHKHYVGRHSVYYRGFAEGKGIWGTWEMSLRSGFTDRGGFHIWPKGMADGTGEELVEEVEVPEGVEERVLVDAVPSETDAVVSGNQTISVLERTDLDH